MRAERAGPYQVTKDATVAEISRADGSLNILRQGTNEWTCIPGDENEIGNVPTACDAQGLIWYRDALSGKPAPTNTGVGLIYMLCGATQRSSTGLKELGDRRNPAIPIGPHYMIIWPFDSKKCGLPTTVRDAGAWVMFDGTPYSHLHICGSPWEGREYDPENTCAEWSMKYVPRD